MLGAQLEYLGWMPAPTRRISTIMTVPEDPVSLLASKSTACVQTHNRQTPMHIKQVIMREEGKGVGRGRRRGRQLRGRGTAFA